MQYKALMLDVDGTTIPYDYQAIPSERVAEAVKKARTKLLVCLVTGRSYGFIEHILEKLGIDSGFAVVNNGAQVIDIQTKSFLYDKPIELSDAHQIVSLLRQKNIPFYVKQDTFKESVSGGYFNETGEIQTPYMIFTDEILSNDQVDDVFKELSDLSTISLNKGHHKTPNKFSFNICHGAATKLHGIEIILQRMGINKEEIIGIGDGYNDFPLLMASGLKVAMGNSVSELKEIADVIAPNVEDDGVAAIIENYILSDTEKID